MTRSRTRKPKREGYAVWVQYDLRNARREVVRSSWVERTDRRATLNIEMARALTQDVQRMGVPWQIRDAAGNIIEQWPEKNA